MSSVIKIKFFLVFLTKLVTNIQESKVLFLIILYVFKPIIFFRTVRQTWEDFGSQAEQESYLHK